MSICACRPSPAMASTAWSRASASGQPSSPASTRAPLSCVPPSGSSATLRTVRSLPRSSNVATAMKSMGRSAADGRSATSTFVIWIVPM